jgi:hypothetical protein
MQSSVNPGESTVICTMTSPEILEAYEYDELPQSDVIRYLTLHPGSGNDLLECSLHTAPMSNTVFEAVSYVWGSDVRDQQIRCDGRTLALTTNLFRVLQRVRQPHTPRKIWADLICINQENLDEKGHQVAIMGRIYRHASRVLIHMGNDDKGHGPQVSSLLDTICTTIDKILPTINDGWNTFPYPRPNDGILTDPRWDSLCLLLGETWFTRGWVVREAGFARDGQVYWGQSEFSWNSLMRTCNWLYKRAVKTLYARGFEGKIPLAHVEVFEDSYPTYAKLFADEMTWVKSSILGYLSLTRELNLKDPRDRIYAFLELVQNEERPIHLRPNYKDPFLYVYQQFAAEYIRSTAYIGLLSNVEHDEQSLESGIPSWVPRWDICLTRTGYAFAPADSGYPALTSRRGDTSAPTVIDDATLRSSGVIIDPIFYASEPLNIDTTTIDTIAEIWKSIENAAHDSLYSTPNPLIVFMNALTTGTREGDLRSWQQSEAAYYRAIREKNGGLDDHELPVWLAQAGSNILFHNTVKGYTHNRKIVLTERGYIGLAPAVAQKGDLCSIIFGCTTPCILRKTNHENKYKYLGAAYMIGQDHFKTSDGRTLFIEIFGSENSKDWAEWDVEEQDIYLC